MPRRSPSASLPDQRVLNAEELRARLDYDDVRLLAECEVHVHRTGGPGGQHRNKVATAVRLHHRPSGLVVTASERRSQQENRLKALSRLRQAIAIGFRCPPPQRIAWPSTVYIADQQLRVNPRNPAFWQVVALVLDELAACDGQMKRAAARLGVTTSSLTRFLAGHSKAWAEANRIRRAAGLRALRS